MNKEIDEAIQILNRINYNLKRGNGNNTVIANMGLREVDMDLYKVTQLLRKMVGSPVSLHKDIGVIMTTCDRCSATLAVRVEHRAGCSWKFHCPVCNNEIEFERAIVKNVSVLR